MGSNPFIPTKSIRGILCVARTYRQYSDTEIIEKAKITKSIAGLLRLLNLKPLGGNYANLKRNLQRLNVDTSHWTGQGWNKDQQLKDWSEYTKAVHLKPHLIKLRGHQCEICKNLTWLNDPIGLEIHHIDNNRGNNQLENLQLLCPNCHYMTDGFRNRK